MGNWAFSVLYLFGGYRLNNRIWWTIAILLDIHVYQEKLLVKQQVLKNLVKCMNLIFLTVELSDMLFRLQFFFQFIYVEL